MQETKKKKILLFFILLLFSCFLYGSYLTMHYASDTYNIINVGYEQYAIYWSFIDGRIVMGLIGLVANLLSIPINIYVILLTFLALVISSFVVMVIRSMILEVKLIQNKKTEWILNTICFLCIFHFMYMENLYYVESIVMALSLLFYVLATKQLLKNTKFRLWKTFGLLILGVMCYQGTIGLFFAFTFVMTLISKQNKIKQVMKILLECGLLGLAAALVNVGEVKLIEVFLGVEQTRLGQLGQFFYRLGYIFTHIDDVFIKTAHLFPPYLLLAFVLTILTTVWCYVWMAKKEKRILLDVFFIAVVTILSSFVIFIITLSSFYTGRLHFCMGALVGLLFLYLYAKTDCFENKSVLQKILLVILLAYFILNVYNVLTITWQHKKVNQLERKQVESIEKQIKQYEEEADIAVQNIGIITIGNQLQKAYFKQIPNLSVLSYNSVRCDWAADGVINYYTGRKLKKKSLTKAQKQEILMQMSKQNRDYICLGDTLYIATYMY